MLAHDLIYYRYPIQGKHPEPNSKTGKNDILFKDRNPPSKTIPFWAARHTYLTHIWGYPPRASTKRKPQYLIQYAAA